MPAWILIVEREQRLAHWIRQSLEAAGYRADVIESDSEVEIRLRMKTPDLAILDSTSPLSLDLPIISLVTQIEDGLRRLDAGADDFVVKPFSMRELLARVRAVLRRSRPGLDSTTLQVADVELNREAHRVKRANREIYLRPTEYRLLELLMQSPGRVFSREQLLDNIWGPNAGVEVRTVDVHIGRLRKALQIGEDVDPVRTVRGAGYSLNEEMFR
jgi:two-component system phosphate regulon response regulator PhoB